MADELYDDEELATEFLAHAISNAGAATADANLSAESCPLPAGTYWFDCWHDGYSSAKA